VTAPKTGRQITIACLSDGWNRGDARPLAVGAADPAVLPS
jgi:hypothetical protein